MPYIPKSKSKDLLPGKRLHRPKRNTPSDLKKELDSNYDRNWRAVRNSYLYTHPLCERCESQGKLTPAEIVHHIEHIRDGGAVRDTNNLMAVCRACHAILHSDTDFSDDSSS